MSLRAHSAFKQPRDRFIPWVGFASVPLLAKCADALLLYRLEKIFKR
jgi:hypothetical protein